MLKPLNHSYSRLLTALALSLGFGSAELNAAKKASAKKTAPLSTSRCEPRALDHSRPRGVLLHGEHWVDLVLAQAGHLDEHHLTAFTEVGTSLVDAIQVGQLKSINEKIDGSPSFVFGWTPQGKFFIAYKNHFAALNQKLITDAASAHSAFPRSPALPELFAGIFNALAPELSRVRGLRDYIFQADLLFVGDQRRINEGDALVIKANTIPYRIATAHPLHRSAAQAQIGLAVHSVGLRRKQIDRLDVAPLEAGNNGRELIERLSKQLRSDAVFLIHPHRDAETLMAPAKPEFFNEASHYLSEVASHLRGLDADFRETYRSGIESEFRIYINSFLRNPREDGLFQTIARGEDIAPLAFIENFRVWLGSRETNEKSARALQLLAETKNRNQLEAVVNAYVAANRLQNLLAPSLSPAMRSKLGDGPVEGLMLSTPHAIVKLVDRLNFTIANNVQNQRRTTPVAPKADTLFTELAEPFNEWRPGQSFALMKGQPWHSGHFKMLRLGQEREGPVVVVASSKAPNLKAETWKSLGAADTLGKLRERNYKHVFSGKVRRELFAAGLSGQTEVQVFYTATHDMWRYLKIAQENGLSGKIRLLVGQKEIDEGRYSAEVARFADHVELVAVPLQEEGLSATMIRALIKDAALGDALALEKLDEAYSCIADETERKKLITSMLKEWKAVDRAARRILKAHDKK